MIVLFLRISRVHAWLDGPPRLHANRTNTRWRTKTAADLTNARVAAPFLSPPGDHGRLSFVRHVLRAARVHYAAAHGTV
jgi:hypothetical protein